MALKKTIITDNDIVANYHRLDYATIDHNRTLVCLLNSYAEEQYAIDGNEVDSYFYSFYKISEDEELIGVRTLAYQKIKE